MYLKLEIGLYKNMVNAPKDLEVFEKSWMINNFHYAVEPDLELLKTRIWHDYLKYQALLIELKKPVNNEPKGHISQLHVFPRDCERKKNTNYVMSEEAWKNWLNSIKGYTSVNKGLRIFPAYTEKFLRKQKQ